MLQLAIQITLLGGKNLQETRYSLIGTSHQHSPRNVGGQGILLFQADTLRLGLAGAIEIEHLGVSVQSGLVVLG